MGSILLLVVICSVRLLWWFTDMKRIEKWKNPPNQRSPPSESDGQWADINQFQNSPIGDHDTDRAIFQFRVASHSNLSDADIAKLEWQIDSIINAAEQPYEKGPPVQARIINPKGLPGPGTSPKG